MAAVPSLSLKQSRDREGPTGGSKPGELIAGDDVLIHNAILHASIVDLKAKVAALAANLASRPNY